MKREDIQELHYITPIANIRSILDLGILSHARAQRLHHESVANQGVQHLRAQVRLPTGRQLHEHVNLYFHARNPMMYVRKERHHLLAVLRIDPQVLDLLGVMITDGNAARRFGTRFALPDEPGFALLDERIVLADDWNHPVPHVKDELKRIRCAEVLVPDIVDPRYIRGAYVSCSSAHQLMVESGCAILIVQSEHMFFRGPRRQE